MATTLKKSLGRIEIIMGCMFSGKSTEIIKIINKYKILNKKIMAITHSIDNRYNSTANIVTHDKLMHKCINSTTLTPLNNTDLYKNADVIVIEEAQFFPDLYKFVINGVEKDKKTLIIAGLDGDYKREPFGDILKLIPHAEKVTKLEALCLICNNGTPAAFTKRIVESTEQTLVGSNDSYVAVCREHL
jgi:thymidine kinase